MTTTRRKLITTGALGGAAALAAPAIVKAQAPIKWRMQTYAGVALGEHVCKPAIDFFNEAANGEMEIELYYADQLVPTSELFAAMQRGTIDAVQSDDDSMQSPTEVTVFGGYFPLALRYSLDVPVLFNQYGLKEIWEEEYAKHGIKLISSGSWDPCNFSTRQPINSLADLDGLRIYTFPTAGRFLAQFGVVPVQMPHEDIQVSLQTGVIDGVCWSGITEVYTIGWADVTNYYLTNPVSGAWIGHFFANNDQWEALPPHLKALLQVCTQQSHYYRQWWYWGGEAEYRTGGDKLELTTVPSDEWVQVEEAAARFWDEVATESDTKARVVEIFKRYNETMVKAGAPYRY